MTQLLVFDSPINWSGQYLPKSDIMKLQIGDFVRLYVSFNNGGGVKYYVKITDIIRYSYGGIHKPRRFKGTLVNVYNEFTDSNLYPPSIHHIVYEGKEICFRPCNIMEIPNWKGETPIPQKNEDIFEKWILKQEKIKNDIEDLELTSNSENYNNYIKELHQKYNQNNYQISKNKVRKMVNKYRNRRYKLTNNLKKQIELNIQKECTICLK